MDTTTKAKLIEEGSKLLSDGIRIMINRPAKAPPAACSGPPVPPPVKTVQVPAAQNLASETGTPAQTTVVSTLPTTAETTHELKRRLARELYRAELDLAGGLKINGKACDCLEYKHSVGLDAAAEELVSQDPNNPVYREIIKWLNDNLSKLTVQAILTGNYDTEYPRMALQLKEYRKRVVGTSQAPTVGKPAPTLTLEEAKKMAASQAAAEVERQWNSQAKK